MVHTGQHYDAAMNDVVFEQLKLPRPDINLEVGSASHAQQTGEVMKRIEPVLLEKKPAAVLVVGDVNSTIAAALVAVKLGIKVIHVEAGLRSRDRTMPEEINRILTDQISDILFTTEREAEVNLKAEGIPASRVEFVGNVMIDSLRAHLAAAVSSSQTAGRTLPSKGYALVTLHRPANVDDPAVLENRFWVRWPKSQPRCRWCFPFIRARLRALMSSAPMTFSPRPASSPCRRRLTSPCWG